MKLFGVTALLAMSSLAFAFPPPVKYDPKKHVDRILPGPQRPWFSCDLAEDKAFEPGQPIPDFVRRSIYLVMSEGGKDVLMYEKPCRSEDFDNDPAIAGKARSDLLRQPAFLFGNNGSFCVDEGWMLFAVEMGELFQGNDSDRVTVLYLKTTEKMSNGMDKEVRATYRCRK